MTNIKNMKLAKKLKKQREASKRSLSAQYDNTTKCIEFYNGNFMSYQDKIQFRDAQGNKKRALVQFNKVKPNVDAVVGFMAQNRRKAKFVARMTGSTAVAGMYSLYTNSIHDYVRENANADHIETDQDADMMINGYGAVETDISYVTGNSTTDPNGEVIMERLDPKCVGWDAHAKGKNLIDRRWNYYWKDYDLEEALNLFDEQEADDFEAVGADDDMKGMKHYNVNGGRYTAIKEHDTVEWANKNEEMVRVYNHQWFEYETYYRAENPLYNLTNPEAVAVAQAKLEVIADAVEREEINGIEYDDMFDFDPTAETLVFDDKIKAMLLEQFGELIEPVDFKRKVYYTAICSGDEIFKTFKSISQQAFSVQFKTGIYDASRKVWTGMVNSMMEPARYHSKVLTELLFTIASNSKGGVMVETDAVEDISEFNNKWAKTDAVIEVNEGALSGGKIQEKAKPQVPTGLEGMVQLTDQAISDTSGIDPAFLGAREDNNESGILYRRRIRQIISTMARYMDSISMYQKLSARVMADYIKVWAENNKGGLVKIVGEDGSEQYVEIASDKLAAEYDTSIQDAPLTPEEKQETAMVISGYGDKLISVGAINEAKAFYVQSLDFLNIDQNAKQTLIEALQPQETVPIEQFKQLQAQLEQLTGVIGQLDIAKKQAEVKKTEADAEQSQAKAEGERAKSVETLEKAAQTGLENDLVRSDEYTEVQVRI